MCLSSVVERRCQCYSLHLHTGEGGTFALYQGLYPPDRHAAGVEDASVSSESNGDGGEKALALSVTATGMPVSTSTASPRYKWPLFVWVRARRSSQSSELTS